MRKAARLVPLLLIALLFLAWTGTPTDSIITVEYDEPSTNTDGSALTDLVKTRIYWKIDTGAETFVDVPASRPQGGTHMIRQVNVPIALNQGGVVSAQVTAWDPTVESARSNTATVTIDRKFPKVPGNFRIAGGAPPPPPPPPPPTGPNFTINGITEGQIVSGMISVGAVPVLPTGVTFNSFTFTLLNSAGNPAVPGNQEFATPYCFVGDDGIACTPFNTVTIPNGAYTMRILMTTSGGNPTKDVHITVSN